jgi:Putative Actinobacterial Holin-X, holin superfamily III
MDSLRSTTAPVGGASTNGDAPHTPAESLRELPGLLGELKAYIGYLISTKVDGIKLSLRNVGIYAALGIVGLIVGGAMLVTAMVLVVVGLSGGLSALIGIPWLANLIVGVVILGLTAGGIVVGLKRITASSRKQTVAKYEQKRREQHVEQHHDVAERAHEPQ